MRGQPPWFALGRWSLVAQPCGDPWPPPGGAWMIPEPWTAALPPQREVLPEQKPGFPNVIGAIDCTHVRIKAPAGPTEPDYINRKSYHSINVQARNRRSGGVIPMTSRAANRVTKSLGSGEYGYKAET
ncbi:HARB1 nuclease, partial [Polypterus senegalus]